MTETENLLRIQLIKRRLAGEDLTREELAKLVELQEMVDILIHETFEVCPEPSEYFCVNNCGKMTLSPDEVCYSCKLKKRFGNR
jgi:hypothetical protein